MSSCYVMKNKKYFMVGDCLHIIQRAPGADILFNEESDYLYFLHLMKVVSKNYSINFIAFALMKNHVHLLLKINQSNLDIAMKRLFQAYAQYFNKKYKRRGAVFGGVYAAIEQRTKNQLLATSVYIHLNPYKAKIVDDPINYKWSSILVYCNNIDSKLIKSDQIFQIISKKSCDSACCVYKEMLETGKKGNYKEFSYKGKYFDKLNTDIARVIIQKTKDLFIQSDISSVAEFLEVQRKIENLRSKKRFNKNDSESLSYVIKQLESRGYNKNEIAEELSISRVTLNKFTKLLPTDM